MEKKEAHLGLRMERSAHDKLKYIAAYEGRSINKQVLHLITTCIREFERANGPIDLDENGHGQA